MIPGRGRSYRPITHFADGDVDCAGGAWGERDGDELAADTMALFAAETKKLKPRFLIVDTTEFFHRWADDMMAWRDKEIIPQYNARSVTKFAFIAGEEMPFPTVESGANPAPEGPATFPTGWFAGRDRAYEWLAG